MKKLILPMAEIIGTPLSDEELKSIIAGSIMSGECSCDYILANYTSGTSDLGTVDSEEVCSMKCKELCETVNKAVKCATYRWHYAGSGSGSVI